MLVLVKMQQMRNVGSMFWAGGLIESRSRMGCFHLEDHCEGSEGGRRLIYFGLNWKASLTHGGLCKGGRNEAGNGRSGAPVYTAQKGNDRSNGDGDYWPPGGRVG